MQRRGPQAALLALPEATLKRVRKTLPVERLDQDAVAVGWRKYFPVAKLLRGQWTRERTQWP